MLYEWVSITRTIGLIAYTVALVACLFGLTCSIGWVKGRLDDKSRGIYACLACIQLALLLDKVFNWRWKLHEHWMRTAMTDGVYDRRRPFQLVVLAALVVALAAAAVFILRRFRRRPALLMAMTGTLLSIGLWVCEAVSYHYFDRVLFFEVGHAMVVSFLWAGCALLTAIGAFKDGWSYRVG
jgi:hypothetical protein